MAYSRELGDTAWDYLAPLPHTEKYIWMKPVEDHHCECVVLEGALGCSISNSDDPPGSYHTKDLFVAHETMANRWRFVGRLDDRFPMANAENVLPLDIELNVAKEPLVKEAVVFGVGRPVLGILAFRSGTAKNMDDQEFVSAIWPSIEEMNSHTSATAQVSPQMVIPVAADSTYPQTDKRTFIRRRVYEEFELEIEQAYTRLEQGLGL
ncbi:hypothetical protein B0A49_03312 [Cryomyces minteri]|uniref:Uncharacterized protein n=1 Tax=Cryomyces minteri TaxID=331657 RepID=A0A4V5NIZ5_9PEZI|nr:hypothetical protein B0A49_03312 [Cryomyces minteri]